MKTFLELKLAVMAASSFLLLASPRPADAATFTVSVATNNTLTFTPSVISIAPNDTVIWRWNSTGLTGHSTTSDAGDSTVWDSGTSASPHSFTNTFTTAGSYPYHCTPHASFGMAGTVNVIAANAAPTVTITNPANGAVLSAPANIVLAASASDSDGSVTNVQFLQGAVTLANVASAPYAVPVNSLAAGNYTFSAIATDNGGLKATNAISLSVVVPVEVVIGAAQRTDAAHFQFSYSANTGLNYVVQRSTDLSSPGWSSLVTNTATNNPMIFVDAGATNNPGFYRVGRMPNP